MLEVIKRSKLNKAAIKYLIVLKLDLQDTAIQIYSLGISSIFKDGISKPRK